MISPELNQNMFVQFAVICSQLQKDDEEWCYFMRYGKTRRNTSTNLQEISFNSSSNQQQTEAEPGTLNVRISEAEEIELDQVLPIEEISNQAGLSSEQAVTSQKRISIWPYLNAAFSLMSLSLFIGLFWLIFFIFHNVDNKPWTSIFTRLFNDDNSKNVTTIWQDIQHVHFSHTQFCFKNIPVSYNSESFHHEII